MNTLRWLEILVFTFNLSFTYRSKDFKIDIKIFVFCFASIIGVEHQMLLGMPKAEAAFLILASTTAVDSPTLAIMLSK